MFCSLYGITRMYVHVLEKCATFWTTLYIISCKSLILMRQRIKGKYSSDENHCKDRRIKKLVTSSHSH